MTALLKQGVATDSASFSLVEVVAIIAEAEMSLGLTFNKTMETAWLWGG